MCMYICHKEWQVYAHRELGKVQEEMEIAYIKVQFSYRMEEITRPLVRITV